MAEIEPSRLRNSGDNSPQSQGQSVPTDLTYSKTPSPFASFFRSSYFTSSTVPHSIDFQKVIPFPLPFLCLSTVPLFVHHPNPFPSSFSYLVAAHTYNTDTLTPGTSNLEQPQLTCVHSLLLRSVFWVPRLLQLPTSNPSPRTPFLIS